MCVCNLTCNGSFQKLPTYTFSTSGVEITLPMLHRRLPYTRTNWSFSIWSALFRTHRTLSSCGLSASITSRNSSEMSSLCASKRSRIRSERSANHVTTSEKE